MENKDELTNAIQNNKVIAVLIVLIILCSLIQGAKVNGNEIETISIPQQIPKTQQDFILMVAENISDKTIFSSIVIAQACCESNYGQSELAKNSNNLFGIKADSSWKGKFIVRKDDSVNDKFRVYGLYSESIRDHNNFLKNNERYTTSGVFYAKTVEEQLQSICKAGYATDPNYYNMILKIIDNFNLRIFDRLHDYPVDGQVTSRFGIRAAPSENASTNHQGIDFAVASGTKVKSLIGGIVTSGNDNLSGNWVKVTNGNYQEVFCHLSQVYTISKVNPGEYIGLSGKTGNATGDCLHYGFKVNGVAVDPLKFIK